MRLRDIPALVLGALMAIPLYLLVTSVHAAMDSAMAEVEARDRQQNHALAEGAPTLRPTNEREKIDQLLRMCRDGRYHAPMEWDFMDDLFYHVEKSYEHSPDLWEVSD